MPAKNAETTIKKSILSFLNQSATDRNSILLIGNDQSNDKTADIIRAFLPNPRIILLDVDCGTAYLNRNFLNNYVRQNFPNCVLIGRLDADDILCTKTILREIEILYDTHRFEVLLCSNKQSRKNMILPVSNLATNQLLDTSYILKRLALMANNMASAELPSCNIFISPIININYPSQLSAEDHWFLIDILLRKNKLHIHIESSLIYCIYSLDGASTHHNQKNNEYKKSRKKLYNHYNKKRRYENR